MPLQLDRLHESIDERNPCVLYWDTKEEEIEDRLQTRSVFCGKLLILNEDAQDTVFEQWLRSFETVTNAIANFSADWLAAWGLICKHGLTTEVKIRLNGPLHGHRKTLSADLLATWGLSGKQGLTPAVKVRLNGPLNGPSVSLVVCNFFLFCTILFNTDSMR